MTGKEQAGGGQVTGDKLQAEEECSTLHDGTWTGIYKKEGTFFVKISFGNDTIQLWKCKNDAGEWTDTHSYLKDDKFYSAILLENLSESTCNIIVNCTKRNGKSKR